MNISEAEFTYQIRVNNEIFKLGNTFKYVWSLAMIKSQHIYPSWNQTYNISSYKTNVQDLSISFKSKIHITR